MAVRASDRVTLVRAATPTNVRPYFLLQDSMLAAPARPADSPSGTNPPPSPWSTQEPTYTPGATVTLYRVELTVWGDGSFQYGPVQVDSAYEAAKAAYNAAAAAQGTASSALTSANGKNRIVRSTAVAGGAASYQAGDQWWQYSGANIIATWIHDGTIWVSYKMNHQVLGSIDATNITVGVLNGAILAARSATIDKLLITSLENLVQDASFEVNNALAWNLTAPTTNSTTNPRTGARALSMGTQAAAYVGAQSAQSVRVEAGEKYRVGMWIRRGAGTSGLNPVAIRFLTGATEASTPSVDADVLLGATAGDTSYTGIGTTYVRVSGVWTVPANAKYARANIVVRDTTASQVYHVDDFEMFKMSQGELIVDGAIDGKVITGATVQTLQDANRGVKLDSFGLRAWDAAGNETVSISSATGAATFSGEFRSKTVGQELRIWSEYIDDGGRESIGRLDVTPGATHVPVSPGGLNVRTYTHSGGYNSAEATLTAPWVRGDGSAFDPVMYQPAQLTLVNGNDAGQLPSSLAELRATDRTSLWAGSTEAGSPPQVGITAYASDAGQHERAVYLYNEIVEGARIIYRRVVAEDTAWTDITSFATGWSSAAGVNRVRLRRQGNRVDMFGAIARSGTTGTGTNMFTIPVGFRIPNTTGSMIIGHTNTSTGVSVQLRYSMAANAISLDGSYQVPAGSTIGSGAVIPMNATWYVGIN